MTNSATDLLQAIQTAAQQTQLFMYAIVGIFLALVAIKIFLTLYRWIKA